MAVDHHYYAHDNRLPKPDDELDGLRDPAMTPAWEWERQHFKATRALAEASSKTAAPGPLGWQSWTAEAACRGEGAEEFYGPHGSGRRWCRRCGVAEVCFWWAVAVETQSGEFFGIWGDASPAVRRQVAGLVGAGGARARLKDALAEWSEQASAIGEVQSRQAG